MEGRCTTKYTFNVGDWGFDIVCLMASKSSGIARWETRDSILESISPSLGCRREVVVVPS